MKHLLLTVLGCLLTVGLYAQTPQGINYQAVARDGDGNLLANQNVSVSFAIRPIIGGSPVYVEDHQLMTNTYGLFTAVIGEGNATTGDFATIDWSTAYELGLSVNGTNLGFVAFQSVPYALNVAPRSEVIAIPAGIFTPNRSNLDFFNSQGAGGASITNTNGGATAVLNAPAQLPQGARLDSMTVYYIDQSEAELDIELIKESFGPNFTFIGRYFTPGNEAGIRNETVELNHVVNNEDGGYYLRVFCGDWNAAGAKQIKGVKIYYTR